jgi:hypothetical protein
MDASLAAEGFSFETSYDTGVLRPEYAAHRRSSIGLTEKQLFAAFAVVGIAFLFSAYTIALGASILAVVVFGLHMRHRSQKNRKRMAGLEEPRALIRIRVTDTGYSIRGDDFFAETSWARVINGFEADAYLLVQSWRMPRLYLPIEEMRAAGVYDRVRAIVDAKSAERNARLAELNGVRP